MRERWHGTSGGYSNHHCRCDDCRRAWRVRMAEYRSRLRLRVNQIPHGTTNGYENYGCRCWHCKRAAADAQFARRA